MTRKIFVSALSALALSVGTAGVAAASNSESYGVIIPPMSVSSPASGPQAPSATNPGETQIAKQLQTFPGLNNVDPTRYTATELQNILEAARKGDTTTLNFYLRRENAQPGGPGVGATNPGKSQIAAQLGLNPKAYTSAQLQRIAYAVENGNLDEAAFVASQAAPSAVN